MTRKSKLLLFIMAVALTFSACDKFKKKLGDRCLNSRECATNSCMTVEGHKLCTKHCSTVSDCPSDYDCVELNVKRGYSVNRVKEKHCIAKSKLKKMDEVYYKNLRENFEKKWKDYLDKNAEKLSAKSTKVIENIMKKHVFPVDGNEKGAYTVIELAEYGNLRMDSIMGSKKKSFKANKDHIKWVFIPVPKDTEDSKKVITVALMVHKKLGNDEFWRWHKKMAKSWSRNNSKLAIEMAIKAGMDKKDFVNLEKHELRKVVDELLKVADTVDTKSDCNLVIDGYIFKGYKAVTDLERIVYDSLTKALYDKRVVLPGAKKAPAADNKKPAPEKKK
ncbi:hypothetical protein KKF34_03370 [Myxococcota bacterium]|nr:hypothetical protein [Myxococcota bacterium]MBU1380688.1 hypothetical protein [Myxococcota bacterium]MBU1495896.1 hypothetical protein [Myxococcota bacterium]